MNDSNKKEPKWLYRLEFKDDSCGLWYNGKGGWCFEEGIGALGDECKTKTLPMDYDWRYKQNDRDWFSSCSNVDDLLHWYSKEDAQTLMNNGFVFTRYLATEYVEYPMETVFIKETCLKREEIDFLSLFNKEKNCSECAQYKCRDNNKIDYGFGIINEFIGLEHYCDKCPERCEEWKKTHNSASTNTNVDMECFESKTC